MFLKRLRRLLLSDVSKKLGVQNWFYPELFALISTGVLQSLGIIPIKVSLVRDAKYDSFDNFWAGGWVGFSTRSLTWLHYVMFTPILMLGFDSKWNKGRIKFIVWISRFRYKAFSYFVPWAPLRPCRLRLNFPNYVQGFNLKMMSAFFFPLVDSSLIRQYVKQFHQKRTYVSIFFGVCRVRDPIGLVWERRMLCLRNLPVAKKQECRRQPAHIQ